MFSSNLLRTVEFTLENEYFSRIIFIIRDIVDKRIRGAMVARLTPDQKVACSIHVGFNFVVFIFFYFFMEIGRASCRERV